MKYAIGKVLDTLVQGKVHF